jgi:hypothetical protein
MLDQKGCIFIQAMHDVLSVQYVIRAGTIATEAELIYQGRHCERRSLDLTKVEAISLLEVMHYFRWNFDLASFGALFWITNRLERDFNPCDTVTRIILLDGFQFFEKLLHIFRFLHTSESMPMCFVSFKGGHCQGSHPFTTLLIAAREAYVEPYGGVECIH